MKNKLLILLCLMTTVAFGQVGPPFSSLTFSNLTHHFLWDMASLELPESIFNGDSISQGQAQTFLKFSEKALVDPQGLNGYSETYYERITRWGQLLGSSEVIPLGVVDVSYQYIDTTLYNNQIVFSENNGWVHPQNESINLSSGKMCFGICSVNSLRTGKQKFRLSSQDLITDLPLSDYLTMEIDFGSGWQNFGLNQVVEAIFPDNTEERTIRIKLVTLNETRIAVLKVLTVGCVSSFDYPVEDVPWPTDGDPDLPFKITAPTEDGANVVHANAYYLPNGDFDKPFIFVEGIDFERNISKYGCGSFGWCEFTSGITDPDYDYAVLARMPILLNEVLAHGYDIILLDFFDGATHIEDNAQLLIKLIQMVNENKSGNEPNVIAGASMGGQVSRYALTYMEQNSMEHCARLWVSLDSPHLGANIPMGLQQLIKMLASSSADAESFIVDNLDRPAARQLLNYQVVDLLPIPSFLPGEFSEADFLAYSSSYNAQFSPSQRNEWYSNLDDLGWPLQSRNLGIANGSGYGIPLPYDANTPLISMNCEITPCSSGEEVIIRAWPAPGDQWFSDAWGNTSNSDNYVSAQVVLSSSPSNLSSGSGWLNSVAGFANNAVNACTITKDKYLMRLPSDLPRIDYAAGGYRNSVATFVEKMNNITELVDYCGEIQSYTPLHCFVSTPSAIGLDNFNLNESVLTELSSYDLSDFHFERVYTSSTNEGHSEISSEILELLRTELFSGEDENGNPILGGLLNSLSPNNGVFNYGIQGFGLIRSVNVGNGGKLKILSNEPVHFGLNSNLFPVQNSLFIARVGYGCSESVVNIQNGGKFQIGDGSNYRAVLKICKNGIVDVQSGGRLDLNDQSNIQIENGGKLILREGGSIYVNSVSDFSTIFIEEGGELILDGGKIYLNGETARILVESGRIVLLDGSSTEITSNSGTSGLVELKSSVDHEFTFGVGSELKISGLDENDVMLKISDWDNMWPETGNGTFRLYNCKVDLNNNGQIWLGPSLSATSVRFVDMSTTNGSASIEGWGNNMSFTLCDFENVSIKANYVSLNCSKTTFQNERSNINLVGGRYNISLCEFYGAELLSEGLQSYSTVSQSSFLQNHGPSGTAIEDQSIVDVFIQNSTIEGYREGVIKTGGNLVLRCNSFIENLLAVQIEKASIDMSTKLNGGYNVFYQNDYNVELESALHLNMYMGYNSMEPFGILNINGSIADPCIPECSAVLDCSSNVWTTNSDGEPIGVYVTSNSDFSYCSGNSCPQIVDYSPVVDVECKVTKPKATVKSVSIPNGLQSAVALRNEDIQNPVGVLKTESYGNPIYLINTTNFNQVPIDSALNIAVGYMELYDSLGNNATAIELFYEILNSGIDRSNDTIRGLSNFGLHQMKLTYEGIMQDASETSLQGGLSFDENTLKYVEVLNVFTDTVLNSLTYKDQFEVELMKGQLFITLGNPEMASLIFANLDNCELDSIEIQSLIEWKAICDLQSERYQDYLEGLEYVQIVDSLAGEEGADDYATNISSYYFGAWIFGPSDVMFVSCDSDMNYKELLKTKESVILFPNPSKDEVVLNFARKVSIVELTVFNSMGQKVLEERSFNENETNAVSVRHNLPPGDYVLRVTIAGDVIFKKFVVI